eukprot:jgi/Botrbrau1/2578/Bobra.145_1s0006.1
MSWTDEIPFRCAGKLSEWMTLQLWKIRKSQVVSASGSRSLPLLQQLSSSNRRNSTNTGYATHTRDTVYHILFHVYTGKMVRSRRKRMKQKPEVQDT